MSTDLSGATSPGDPGVWPSTPGEFAARWNDRGFAGRAELIAVLVENAQHAHDCWAQMHVPDALVQQMLAKTYRAGQVDALRQAAGVLEQVGHVEAAACVDGMAAQERWERAERGA